MSDNKRIVKNTTFLYLRMFLVLVIGLYTSRVVLQTLGVEDFGIYNVVAGFVSLFGFLNSTLASSMQRFYNYEIGKGEYEGVTKVYNIGLIIHLVLAGLIVLLLESVGLWYINNIMVIPPERLFTANIVFHTTVLSMVVVIMQIPYTGAVLAYEKMSFYAIVSIIDVFLRLLVVLSLQFIDGDSLIIYSILLLLVTIFDFVLTISYVLKKFPLLKFRRLWDAQLFKSILSFSGWNLLGTFAFMLKGQGINMVINYFTGPIVNAARGVAFQVNSAVSGFSSNITVSFRPQIVSSYAAGEHERSLKLMFLESKICYSLLCILVVPLILEMSYVLRLWLGDDIPQHSELFTSLVLIDMIICSLNTPLTHLAHATGNIKIYQIACSCVNILLVPFCWFFMHIGFGPTSAFVCTIVFSILNQFVCLSQLHRIFNYSNADYFKEVLLPCLIISVLLPILPYYVHTIVEESFGRVVIVSMVDLICALFLIILFVLNKNERSSVKLFLNKKIKK